MKYTTMPHEPFNPWGMGRSIMPYWEGTAHEWGAPGGFGGPTGGCFPGGVYGDPRGLGSGGPGGFGGWGRSFGGGFGGGMGGGSHGWPGGGEPGFSVNLSGEDIMRSLSWIPAALREAANDIESSDTTRRLQSEGAARGIFGYLKGTLSAFGVEASIDAGVERRGVSVSFTYSRAALLSTADAIERVLGEAQSRGFGVRCEIEYSRSFAGVMRGLSGSCSASISF